MKASNNTMVQILKKLEKEGFADHFKPNRETIAALKANHVYYPSQLKVIEQYSFPQEEKKEVCKVLALEGVNGIRGIMLYREGPHLPSSNPLIGEIPVAKPKRQAAPKERKQVRGKAPAGSTAKKRVNV